MLCLFIAGGNNEHWAALPRYDGCLGGDGPHVVVRRMPWWRWSTRGGTTVALVEMVHTWCEATEKSDTFVRALIVDCRKAFDHTNHDLLIAKLCGTGLSVYRVRWMAAFLVDRQQSVKVVTPCRI